MTPFPVDFPLLKGQTAIVTGGAQGIGAAIASTLAQAEASVMIVDIDGDRARAAAEEARRQGRDVTAEQCDVTSQDDHDRVVAACLDRYGAVDILVNNAGVTQDAYIAKMTERQFDIVMDVSLKGAWLGTRAVAPHMRGRGSGAVVNVSSLSGKIGNPGQSNYSAAKAGLVGLTKACAKEFGPAGVRVNAVQPGLVRTEMTLAMKPEVFAVKEAEVPLGRAGTPEEVARSVLFLASPWASYVNGAVLEVTGGRGI